MVFKLHGFTGQERKMVEGRTDKLTTSLLIAAKKDTEDLKNGKAYKFCGPIM